MTTEQEGAPVPSDNSGLRTSDAWRLVEIIVRNQEAFVTADGLVGRSILDYPPGFRFAPPRGVDQHAMRRHRTDEPAYVLWAYGPDEGASPYTVAWWGEARGWFIPGLVTVAPIEVRRHQWLVRSLTMYPLPEMRAGVDV